MEDGDRVSRFNIWTILPKSLQEFYLYGFFDPVTWQELIDMLGNPHPAVLNCTKLCVEGYGGGLKGRDTKFFENAKRPPPVYTSGDERVFNGHGSDLN